MKNINFYFIRHGQSIANATTPNIIGQETFEELSELGKEQAKLLGERFKDTKFDYIASSTYERALSTAEIFAKTIGYERGILQTKALVEYSPGELKGKEREEVYSHPDIIQKFDKLHMHYKFPNGESLFQVERRAATYLEDNFLHNKFVLEMAAENDLNIAIFSHGITIKTLLHYVLGFDANFCWKISVYNTSVCHLIFNDDGWFLNSINDISHLK